MALDKELLELLSKLNKEQQKEVEEFIEEFIIGLKEK